MYSSEFSNERARVERRANFYRARKKQQFSEALSAYLEWITQAGSILKMLWNLRQYHMQAYVAINYIWTH